MTDNAIERVLAISERFDCIWIVTEPQKRRPLVLPLCGLSQCTWKLILHRKMGILKSLKLENLLDQIVSKNFKTPVQLQLLLRTRPSDTFQEIEEAPLIMFHFGHSDASGKLLYELYPRKSFQPNPPFCYVLPHLNEDGILKLARGGTHFLCLVYAKNAYFDPCLQKAELQIIRIQAS